MEKTRLSFPLSLFSRHKTKFIKELYIKDTDLLSLKPNHSLMQDGIQIELLIIDGNLQLETEVYKLKEEPFISKFTYNAKFTRGSQSEMLITKLGNQELLKTLKVLVLKSKRVELRMKYFLPSYTHLFFKEPALAFKVCKISLQSYSMSVRPNFYFVACFEEIEAIELGPISLLEFTKACEAFSQLPMKKLTSFQFHLHLPHQQIAQNFIETGTFSKHFFQVAKKLTSLDLEMQTEIERKLSFNVLYSLTQLKQLTIQLSRIDTLLLTSLPHLEKVKFLYVSEWFVEESNDLISFPNIKSLYIKGQRLIGLNFIPKEIQLENKQSYCIAQLISQMPNLEEIEVHNLYSNLPIVMHQLLSLKRLKNAVIEQVVNNSLDDVQFINSGTLIERNESIESLSVSITQLNDYKQIVEVFEYLRQFLVALEGLKYFNFCQFGQISLPDGGHLMCEYLTTKGSKFNLSIQLSTENTFRDFMRMISDEPMFLSSFEIQYADSKSKSYAQDILRFLERNRSVTSFRFPLQIVEITAEIDQIFSAIQLHLSLKTLELELTYLNKSNSIEDFPYQMNKLKNLIVSKCTYIQQLKIELRILIGVQVIKKPQFEEFVQSILEEIQKELKNMRIMIIQIEYQDVVCNMA